MKNGLDITNKSEAYRAKPMSPAAMTPTTATRPPDTPVGAVLPLWLDPTGIDVVLWPVCVGVNMLPVPVAEVWFVLVVATGAVVHGVVGVAPLLPVPLVTLSSGDALQRGL